MNCYPTKTCVCPREQIYLCVCTRCAHGSSRRLDEATIEVGEAALALQEMMQEGAVETRPRRRAHQNESVQEQFQRAQKALAESQQRLSAYEEAQSILEDCVAHIKRRARFGRILPDPGRACAAKPGTEWIRQKISSPWLDALSDVLHRIEHVGTPDEE